MKPIGLIMIGVGCLGGAYVACLDPKAIEWAWFIPFLVVGAVGVLLVQIATRRAATQADVLAAHINDIERSMAQIVVHIRSLDDKKSEIDVYDLPDKIDELFRTPISTFVDARETLGHIYGLQAYADIMGEFAAGERYLNRVWSASAEGYIDEAHTYLSKARTQLASAQEKILALKTESPSS